MKHINRLKMLMVAAAIVTPIYLIASVPAFAAKPVKETVCNVGSTPHLSIQDAVDDHNCDSINLPAGTFGENVNIGVGRDIAIRGSGPDSTIVNGGYKGPVFVIGASTVTLKGMTITGGLAGTATFNNGGGIAVGGSTLTLKDCLITDNEAPSVGGGIASYSSSLIIEDSIITHNRAANGGGIRSAGPTNLLIVMDSVISDNVATNQGGGIYGNTPSSTPGTMIVTDSTITDNDAYIGGGIYVNNITLTVKDSTITENTAGTNGGGGIYLGGNSTLTLKDSTISGNSLPEIAP